jgi:hypothetical protein
MPLPILPDQARAEGVACVRPEHIEPAAQLVHLNQRQVAVHIHVQGREQLVFGFGNYEVDPDLGGVLRVQTGDGHDAPELLFVEDLWTGQIRRGHALGCDFLIHLS